MSSAALSPSLASPIATGARPGDEAPPLTVRRLMDPRQLRTVFQPIVQLDCGLVYGHEALVRGPIGSPLEYPDMLFAAGRREGLNTELEVHCALLAMAEWSRLKLPGRLLLNMSATALASAVAQGLEQDRLFICEDLGISASQLMIELTEHERVADIEGLRRAIAVLRRKGVGIALDDFGDGRSSLRLWSEIQPDVVKIDKYFTHDLPAHAEKLQTFRALLQLAETFGAQLVAEGIETQAQAEAARAAGCNELQGFLFSNPLSAAAAGDWLARQPEPVLG